MQCKQDALARPDVLKIGTDRPVHLPICRARLYFVPRFRSCVVAGLGAGAGPTVLNNG